MSNLYHVTHANALENIKQQGLRRVTSRNEHIALRDEMDEYLDCLGRKTHSDWPSRRDRLYFWPTFDKARIYSARNPLPAIVVINPDGINSWQVPNEFVEELYRFCSRNDNPFDKDEGERLAEKVVRSSRPWNGELDDGLEIWAREPVPLKNIEKL